MRQAPTQLIPSGQPPTGKCPYHGDKSKWEPFSLVLLFLRRFSVSVKNNLIFLSFTVFNFCIVFFRHKQCRVCDQRSGRPKPTWESSYSVVGEICHWRSGSALSFDANESRVLTRRRRRQRTVPPTSSVAWSECIRLHVCVSDWGAPSAIPKIADDSTVTRWRWGQSAFQSPCATTRFFSSSSSSGSLN